MLANRPHEHRSLPSAAATALLALRYRSAIMRRLRAAESHLRYVALDLPRSAPPPRAPRSAAALQNATHLAVEVADRVAQLSTQLADASSFVPSAAPLPATSSAPGAPTP